MSKNNTPPISEPGNQAEPTAVNVLQRADTVLKHLKVPAPVAAGVLAGNNLTRTSMVDPEALEAMVAAWRTAPAKSSN